MLKIIQSTMRPLGITRKYRGHRRVMLSVSRVLKNEDCLDAVTKEVYMVVAQQCGCDWTSVEHNIRTAVSRAWKVNPQLLTQMAGYPLDGPPTASEFLEIVANYIRRAVLTDQQ